MIEHDGNNPAEGDQEGEGYYSRQKRPSRKVRWFKRTDEEIIEEGSKYSGSTEFSLQNGGAYCEGLRRGLIYAIFPDACPWTERSDEDVLDAARKFNSAGEFGKGNSGASKEARKRGLMSVVWPDSYGPMRGKWPKATDEELIAEGKRYPSRRVFYKANQPACNEARKRDLMVRIHENTIYRKVPWCSVLDEEIVSLSGQYDTRTDFMTWEPGAYHEAITRDLIDTLFPNTIHRDRWTDYQLLEEAKEFASIGATHARPGLCRQLKKRDLISVAFPSAEGPGHPATWTDEQLLAFAKQFNTVGELKMADKAAAYQMWTRSLNNKVFPKCRDKVASRKYIAWKDRSDEEVEAEMRKRPNRSAARDESQAYREAVRRKIFDRVFPPPVFWTEHSDEDVIAEGRKYVTRRKFQHGCVGAYRAAVNRKLLDVIFPETSRGEPWYRRSDEEIIAKLTSLGSLDACRNGASAALKEARKRKLVEKVYPKRKPWNKFDAEEVREHLFKLKTDGWDRKKLAKEESGLYLELIKNSKFEGVMDGVFLNNHPNTHWPMASNDELEAEASKYDTRTEFARGSNRAYIQVLDRNQNEILDRVFGVKPLSWHQRPDENVIAEGRKFESRTDFDGLASMAYREAYKRELLDTIFEGKEPFQKSDEDVVYLWRSNLKYNGLAVYKCGYTSWRLGEKRIRQVARRNDLEVVEIVAVVFVGNRRGREIESTMLSLGIDPNYPSDWDGNNEFRAMTAEQVGEALAIIKAGELSLEEWQPHTVNGRKRIPEYEFVNRDGRIFTGTRPEFSEFAGLSSTHNLVNNGGVSMCGWRLKGTPDRNPCMPRG
jgi:hypothetical protein